MDAKPRLLEQVRNKLRTKHYSYRTEQEYVAWIRRFILHHGKRHPREMGGREVEQFLTYLAVDLHVAASAEAGGTTRGSTDDRARRVTNYAAWLGVPSDR